MVPGGIGSRKGKGPTKWEGPPGTICHGAAMKQLFLRHRHWLPKREGAHEVGRPSRYHLPRSNHEPAISPAWALAPEKGRDPRSGKALPVPSATELSWTGYSSGINIGSQAGSNSGSCFSIFRTSAGTYFSSATRRNIYSSNHSSVMM